MRDPGIRRLLAWVAALLLAGAGCNAGEGADVKLEVGQPAPGFELPGSDGNVHRLSDFAGKQAVVLAWFPKAFTGG